MNKAIEVFEEMEKSNIKPTPLMYISLIYGSLLKPKNIAKAVSYWNKLLSISPNKLDLGYPASWILGALIQFSATATENFRLELEKLQIQFNREEEYISIINAYAKLGSVQKVEEVVEEMKKKGIISGSVTYANIMLAHSYANNFDKVLQMYEYWTKENKTLDPIIVNIVFDSLGFSKNISKLMDLWQNIVQTNSLNFNINHITSLMEATLRNKAYSEASLIWNYLKSKLVDLESKSDYAFKKQLKELQPNFKFFRNTFLFFKITLFSEIQNIERPLPKKEIEKYSLQLDELLAIATKKN